MAVRRKILAWRPYGIETAFRHPFPSHGRRLALFSPRRPTAPRPWPGKGVLRWAGKMISSRRVAQTEYQCAAPTRNVPLFVERQKDEELSMRKILLCATLLMLALPLASCGNTHDPGIQSTPQ